MELGDIAANAGAGAVAFKTASEGLVALKQLVTGPGAGKVSEVQAALIEAQQSAIQAHFAHSAQIDRVRALEAEVARYEIWNTEKQRYELKDLGDGHAAQVFAYRLKASEIGAEPAHSICPDCYQNRIKSILQQVIRSPGLTRVQICQQCNWEAYTSGHWYPEHGGTKSASRRRS